MADTVTLRCNNVPRNLLSWYELTAKEKREFDYLTTGSDDADEPTNDFFRYKGQIYDTQEFMRIDKSIAPHPQRPNWERFHGYSSDSFFSGVLVRYCNQGESVIVAAYFS